MIIPFKTNKHKRIYTKCATGKIVGSEACKCCRYFVDKVSENKKEDGYFVHEGLVECKATLLWID